jgi:hypothetical protein
LSGDLIYSNTLHDWGNWDDLSGQNSHAGIALSAGETGAQVQGLQVYHNLVYGNETTMSAYLSLLASPSTISSPLRFQ